MIYNAVVDLSSYKVPFNAILLFITVKNIITFLTVLSCKKIILQENRFKSIHAIIAHYRLDIMTQIKIYCRFNCLLYQRGRIFGWLVPGNEQVSWEIIDTFFFSFILVKCFSRQFFSTILHQYSIIITPFVLK